MAKNKGLGCLGKLLITIVIIVLILVIAWLIIGNMTPAKLGVADTAIINGQTLRDFGLQDTKIKELLSFVMSMQSPPKPENIVTNAPTEQDKTNVEQSMSGSSITNQDGSINYGELVNGKVTFAEKKQLTLKDTELAHLFNSVMQVYNQADTGVNEQLEILQRLNAQFLEVTITNIDNRLVLKSVLSLDISEYVGNINIPFIKLSNTLYVTVTNYIDSVSQEGILQLSARTVAVNGQSEQLSALILDNVLNQIAGEAMFSKDDICNGVATAFSYGVSNLGKVGTLVDNVENIGIHAIDGQEGQVHLITYVESDASVSISM